MSFKSREKKRRYRAAEAAQAQGRREQRSRHADRHYLTIVSRAACCNRCGGSLREGAECVYRHTPREILCLDCANREGIRYRPSRSWEQRNRKRNKAGKLVPSPRKA